MFQYLCLGFLGPHFLEVPSPGWDKRSWAKARRSGAVGCGYRSTEGPTDINSLPKQDLKRRSARTKPRHCTASTVLRNSAGPLHSPAQPCTSAQPSLRSAWWASEVLYVGHQHPATPPPLLLCTVLDYRYKTVRLQSTAPVRAAILITFWFYKQDDSEKRITECAEHALGSWCPEPSAKHDTEPPPGAWPAKLHFLRLLFHPSKLSSKS